VAGIWPRRDLALGCAGHYRASTRPTVDVRTVQLSGGQKRSTRRRSIAQALCKKKGTARRPAHKINARRWRAQGHGVVPGLRIVAAASRAARPTDGLAQSAHRGAWPQPCLHMRGLAMPARRSRLVPIGASRSSVAAHQKSPSNRPRLDGRFTHIGLARRRWAQGHERPKSSTPSRGDSSVVRRPAHRQGHQEAHLNAAG
jgi:hypothetical protein